jgi:hypothetical protein
MSQEFCTPKFEEDYYPSNILSGYDTNTMVKTDFENLTVGCYVKVWMRCDKHPPVDPLYPLYPLYKRHDILITKIVYYKDGRTRKPKKIYGKRVCCEYLPCKYKNNEVVFRRNHICSLSGWAKCYCTDKNHKKECPELHERYFSKELPENHFSRENVDKYLHP